MKFPKTSEDVVNEIYISSDKCENYDDLRVRQLIRIISEVADDILVEAVVQVFAGLERVDSSFLDQEIAGRILRKESHLRVFNLISLYKDVWRVGIRASNSFLFG